MIKDILYEEFMQIKNSDKVNIIYFGTSWCDVCTMVKKIIQKLDEEQISNVDIYQVDTSIESPIMTSLKITSIPTTVIIYHNKIIAKEVGYRPLTKFKEIINSTMI